MLLVVFGHLTYYFGWFDLGPLRTYWMGGLGVRIFFVHTCFVLMLSLERQRQSHGRSKFWASFMVRRIFRIYPLSIVIVLIIVLLHLPQAELDPGRFLSGSTDAGTIVRNLLLVQSPANSILGPLWSLPYELAMYVFLPFLFLFVDANKSILRVAIVWAISLLASFVFLAHWPDTDDFLVYVPCFLPGVIAYQLRRTARRQLPAMAWPAVLGALVLLFLWRQTFVSNTWFKSWFVCLAFGVGVTYFAQISARWLTLPSRLIAKYSYGVYLTHFACIWLAFNRLHDVLPRLGRFALFAVLVSALPVLFYHLLEEPMIRLGRRVAARFESTTER